jgi:two-component system sensor histidine kinase KdpD
MTAKQFLEAKVACYTGTQRGIMGQSTGGKPHKNRETGESGRSGNGPGVHRVSWRALSGYLGATLIVAGVAVLVRLLHLLLPGANLSIVFLIAVLVSALRWGVWESIYAAVLSVLMYDFLFVNPVHTFIIAGSQDVLALLAFLVVAVLTGNLTLRIRQQAQDMAQARVLAETERLRTALLSSVSHDLRTPLASIIGSATSLLSYGADFDQAAQTELLQTIREEAERLDRYVGNLLSMTRLESGALELRRDWADAGDLVASALAELAPRLTGHEVVVEAEPDVSLVMVDFVLMEQVLVNLLDNAAKYAPPSTIIRVSIGSAEGMVRIAVADEGGGVPEDDLERVFDKFYRVGRGDSQAESTGLGLSICRGIVEAHGGRVYARLKDDGSGTVFTVELPVEDPRQGAAGEHDGEAGNEAFNE